MVKEVTYNLLQNIGKIEVRQYSNLILAQAKGYGDSGFNILFDYISGSNISKVRIEMTAPVISQRIPMTAPVISDQSSIAFVMPSNYTLETTPKPINEQIQIMTISSRVIAALKFSGRWSKSVFKARSKELLEELDKYEIENKGEVFAMRYSGPFTPWFLRKNEVAVEVKYVL
jgi:hypothetical protein